MLFGRAAVAPRTPLPNGEREGPSAERWEGEGENRIPESSARYRAHPSPSPLPVGERVAAQIVTFGCRLNAQESALIAALASGDPDLVIVNTCAVTAEAERQARQAIRRLKREQPHKRIVVTGCAAQLHPERFAAMPEIARVVGNTEKLRAETWRDDAARVAVSDIMAVHEPSPALDGATDQTRAFIEIQTGCDHRCTFCIIPFARGPSRSVPMERLATQVESLVARGYREVVLTGVDIASYGSDLPEKPRLGGLVQHLLAEVPALERLRLSSLDPAAIDDALFATLADDPRLMPHLHLSLQAGDDMILKRMKRRHSRADALDLAARLRTVRPDVALGADLIAGFPTETDTMFDNTLRLIDEMDLSLVHVFPFSARAGTPAARMPALPGAVVRERARRLRESADTARGRFHARQHGRIARVLVERSGTAGYCEHFARVRLTGTAEPGTIVSAVISGGDAHCLIGRMA
jgi:threonylcarbamoyladenosine tRNA methylthiotransferase MtaB